MKQPDDNSRKQVMVVASTVAVTLFLALIIVFAAFSPVSPEGVVSGMLESISDQNLVELEPFVAGSALAGLQAAADTQDSRWQIFWENGAQLFSEFRIGEVNKSGNQASVIVYYGPGMIQEIEFILQRENRRWKVIDLIN